MYVFMRLRCAYFFPVLVKVQPKLVPISPSEGVHVTHASPHEVRLAGVGHLVTIWDFILVLSEASRHPHQH